MSETITKKMTTKKTPTKKPVGIWSAILEARNIAEPIAKDSHCSMGGGGYDFLSTETVLLECIPIMSKCGLVLLPKEQTFFQLDEICTMSMVFVLTHVASGECIEFSHRLPIENMRQATKGSLAVRTTALQYVIRDILCLPRIEERQPEVDNPDGKSVRVNSSPATDDQLQFFRDKQAESPDPVEFWKRLNTRLENKFGVNTDTLTKDVAEIVIKQFK
tara:strand:- start:542 stop:1195 length:654 start_codon:yes stop_codon:yes gene_type:complete